MDPPSFAEPIVTISESLWLQHKELLHQLYINENKTLKQVKDFMETKHKLPTLRLHDYEVALRDVLKLRKNLKKEDWHSIGVHLSNRKRQGKESEVLWNSVPLAAKKVRKDVLRNRKTNQLCYRSRTAELPVGVVIRTPPGSPSRQLAIIGHPETFCFGPEHATPASNANLTSAIEADSMSWDIVAAHLEPAQVEISRFRRLRMNIPFNQFISGLLVLASTHSIHITSTFEQTWTPGPRLFGSNPSLDMLARVTYHLSNRMLIDWTSDNNKWFLNWLAVSADVRMLRLFFSIKTPTVCAAYEELCGGTAKFANPTVVSILFEIRDIIRENSPITADGVDFLQTAVYLRPRANEMLEIAKRALDYHAQPVHMSQIRSLLLPAAAFRDIEIMRLLVNAVSCSDGEICCRDEKGSNSYPTLQDLARIIRQVCIWESNGYQDDTTLADYIHLLIQGRILSDRCCYDDRPELSIRKSESITIDELVMLCPPMKRMNLYSVILPWSNGHMSFVSKAGIFATAAEGPQSVQQYLRTCKQNDDSDISATMEECLLYAAGLNDTHTASAMLQLGVDPQALPLLNNQERYHKGQSPWNPIILAAAAGSLETLQLLAGAIDLGLFLKSAPVYEVMRLGGPHRYWGTIGRELRRLNILRLDVTDVNPPKSNDVVANGTMPDSHFFAGLEINAFWRSVFYRKRRVEIIAWFRTIAMAYGMIDSLDKEIIGAAMINDPVARGMEGKYELLMYHPCDVLMLDGLVDANIDYHEDDMDLLQLSIRAQCSLRFVEFLLSKGLRVHSRAARQSGNTMLHDALLSWSRDRSKVVGLLLREGAEYTQCGEGLTVLEASLHGVDFSRGTWHIKREDYVQLFTHLFEAGAPVRHCSRPHLEDWQPLISLLLYAGAEDQLIIRVADAGAELNEQGRGLQSGWNKRPLEAAILRGRENLARELIRRGADVHATADDAQSLTALQAACLGDCSLEFVEYLVKVQGADVNEAPAEIQGYTALQGAAHKGSLSVAEFLLDNGAEVNALSESSMYHWLPNPCRALDHASYNGRLDMVEFLLKAGGRSGNGGLDGAIRATKMSLNGLSAVQSVLLDWKEKHGGRIVEEEVEWQRQHPDAVNLLAEV